MINQMELGEEIEINTVGGVLFKGIIQAKAKLNQNDFWDGFVEICPSGNEGEIDKHIFINVSQIVSFRHLETKDEV